jgi:RimJ/RimL family protein N-acetyltransferase
VSDITLVVNRHIDFEEISKIYSNPEDLFLAYPSASFPLIFSEWNTWINKEESDNYSLLFYKEEKLISHLTFKNYKEDPSICYLCFFIIDQGYRGLGLAGEVLSLSYHFAKTVLKKKDLWLVVDENNKPAHSLYKKEKFEVVDIRSAGLRMRKSI